MDRRVKRYVRPAGALAVMGALLLGGGSAAARSAPPLNLTSMDAEIYDGNTRSMVRGAGGAAMTACVEVMAKVQEVNPAAAYQSVGCKFGSLSTDGKHLRLAEHLINIGVSSHRGSGQFAGEIQFFRGAACELRPGGRGGGSVCHVSGAAYFGLIGDLKCANVRGRLETYAANLGLSLVAIDNCVEPWSEAQFPDYRGGDPVHDPSDNAWYQIRALRLQVRFGPGSVRGAADPSSRPATPPAATTTSAPPRPTPSLVVRSPEAEAAAAQRAAEADAARRAAATDKALADIARSREAEARRQAEIAARAAAAQADYERKKREHEAALARNRAAQEEYRRKCEAVRAQGGSCVIER